MHRTQLQHCAPRSKTRRHPAGGGKTFERGASTGPRSASDHHAEVSRGGTGSGEPGKLRGNLSPASSSRGYRGYSFFLTVQDKADGAGSWHGSPGPQSGLSPGLLGTGAPGHLPCSAAASHCLCDSEQDGACPCPEMLPSHSPGIYVHQHAGPFHLTKTGSHRQAECQSMTAGRAEYPAPREAARQPTAPVKETGHRDTPGQGYMYLVSFRNSQPRR